MFVNSFALTFLSLPLAVTDIHGAYSSPKPAAEHKPCSQAGSPTGGEQSWLTSVVACSSAGGTRGSPRWHRSAPVLWPQAQLGAPCSGSQERAGNKKQQEVGDSTLERFLICIL